VIVDTLGLLLAVVVHAASIQDRDGAKLAIRKIRGVCPRLKLIWADGGYAGQLVEWTKQFGGWVLEIVKRSDDVAGFAVLPKRWIVERTLGWLGRHRRMSKDYEMLPASSEAMVYIVMINVMLHRLAPG
jgi:putative transposase